ncbi:BirA family transcriptional regulator, biotin operon repressor / biotin-[acetyl-CoA-carboxylase] ligase [Lutimaribacter pacificus]|uniref:biotin--[biotin carboxyl-carrier protein] ligase n=1 Tax=Lutimaribacter pacificus TaxID=391948 RepID=A0A1H0B0Y7_9RHOB|nr:biotin--[acetyl-CoA-carboxylase] ligase [Lutimaribacter pacificus]SDN38953.1 BirA family transcriptional regulator, biotin operon repressor / biotin-[acetyl-CoA-carboxylase] ligase [Lutimaribacter pacificus]SHJ62249.1 BirA family transcriptional regulator, biotin operon repressor / biotin-[acetyl-CoA-carboxylase] ligase [Lutimaribacter pacificus]
MSWPAGYGRRVLAEVDSTNAEAMRLVPVLTGPEWILALRQTQGRGRRGRAWTDPQGNFAGTLVLRPDGPPDHVALLSFVAALSLYDACVAATGRPEVFALKWPNDVLLNGGKLAGILLESTGGAGGVTHLAIGIGVNLRSAPDTAGVEARAVRPVSLMTGTGANVAPEEFLDLLAEAFAAWKARFDAYGFAPIREAWLARAARLGQEVTARTMRQAITGRFETIDDRGNLVLVTAQGRVAIPAAEIFFDGGGDASGD